MEAEKRERWMRLCVEVADGQDSKRLLELISEIDRLLHESLHNRTSFAQVGRLTFLI